MFLLVVAAVVRIRMMPPQNRFRIYPKLCLGGIGR